MKTFWHARLRLTLLYVVISYFLLGLFTFAAIRSEQQAFEAIAQVVHSRVRGPIFNVVFERQLSNFEANFTRRLLVFDVLLLLAATAASYFLSGRTLAPIEEMVRKQEAFAADASHELRTPLTTMTLEIDAYRRTHSAMEPEMSTLLISLKEEIGRMTGLASGLLQLVRLNQVDQLARSKVDAREIVVQAVASLKDQFKDMNLVVEPSKPLWVKANREQLRQCVLILLDNAYKYTPKGGWVRVETSKQENKVQVCVFNSGEGIDPEDLPHIFERFYRGVHANASGTGLGLAIARGFMQLQEGDVSVLSTAVETKFCLEMPALS